MRYCQKKVLLAKPDQHFYALLPKKRYYSRNPTSISMRYCQIYFPGGGEMWFIHAIVLFQDINWHQERVGFEGDDRL